MSVALRPAGPSDAHFIAEMLVAAAFWRPDGPSGSVRAVLEQPDLAHYVVGWPQSGDLGVIAEGARPVGAACSASCLNETDPGYGFVDEAIPELSMGVEQPSRGQGIGASLLAALIASARKHALAALSLSVERDNYARRLYERFGFQQVGTVGDSLTMLLRL